LSRESTTAAADDLGIYT